MNFIAEQSAQKLRGGYYTQQNLADYLARWVGEIAPRKVLEPSCGDGAFITCLQSLKRKPVKILDAIDTDQEEIRKARAEARKQPRMKSTFYHQDFLKWYLTNSFKTQAYDAVLGNPPFIRYQFLSEEIKNRAEKIFQLKHLPFTKHTNLWVPFVIASLDLLRPGGRLAMVVPSELLHVTHAQGLRDFLKRECAQIYVIDPEELWFEETLQGVVLLLAEKKKKENGVTSKLSILPVKDQKFLEHDFHRHFRDLNQVETSELSGKWLKALLTKKERALIQRIARHPQVFAFKEIATVDVGIVTGSNKTFLVPDQTVSEFRLKKWAHPMFGRSEHVKGVIYDRKTHEGNKSGGLPTNFLWFKDKAFSTFPKSVQTYLKAAEKEEIHKRYKCRIRTPWYNVPSVYAAPVAMLKRCHHFHRLILNQIGAFTTDTAYRVVPKKTDAKRFIFSFINSLTALSAELEGRHYGGGVLELVPSEIERLLVPLAKKEKTDLRGLDRMVRGETPLEELFSVQDKAVLRPLGFKQSECEALRAAYQKLRYRRHRISPEE